MAKIITTKAAATMPVVRGESDGPVLACVSAAEDFCSRIRLGIFMLVRIL